MSSNEVKISAAAVLALLAGVVTQDDLFKNLGFKPQSTKLGATRNPFQYQLSRKALVERVDVEHVLEDDESYLIFSFRRPRPRTFFIQEPEEKLNRLEFT